MKRQFFAVLLLVGFTTLQAQNFKLEDVRAIKNGELIVALTKNKEVNDWITSALNEYWTFSKIKGYANEKEAIAEAKKDDNLFVLKLGATKAYSSTFNSSQPIQYRIVTTGKDFEIESGKGKHSVKNFLPSFDDEVTKEIIVYGISTLNHLLTTMDTKDVPTHLKVKDAYNEYSMDLKNKTLYLPEGWVHSKLTEKEIQSEYDADVKVVSYETWRDAILNKENGIAYCMVVPIPRGSQYVYLHYLVNAADAKVFGFLYPKVGVNVGGVNLSKSNSGYINSKNIEMYNSVLKGDW